MEERRVCGTRQIRTLKSSRHVEQDSVQPTRSIELDLLDKKIRRLVAKLKRNNVHLEVFSHESIDFGSIIGKGGEGIVQNCTVLYNNIPVSAAVKTITNNSDDSLNLTLDEIELLCLARDPIVSTTLQVYGVAAMPEKTDPSRGHLVIITEIGVMNALQLYQNEAVPLSLTYDIWSRLAAALHCMHCKNIMHLDLKPENVLITRIIRDSLGQIEKVDLKIIDLGMAQLVLTDRIYTDDILGTTGYHAPEVLLDECYDMRADIFVLGITFCVMLMRQSCLKKTTLQATLKRIHEAKENGYVGRRLFENEIQPSIPSSNLPPAIKNMICLMLESVDKRNITLLDIARVCGQESVKMSKNSHQALTGRSLSLITPRDSGIDSTSLDTPSRRHSTSDDNRSSSAMSHGKSQPIGRSPIYLRRRQKTRDESSRDSCSRLSFGVTDSTSDDSQSPRPSRRRHRNAGHRDSRSAHDMEQVNEDDEDMEPICRRTRSAKLHADDDVIDSESETLDGFPSQQRRYFSSLS